MRSSAERTREIVRTALERSGGWTRRLPQARAWLLSQPRHVKRILLMLSDLGLLSIAVWLSFSIRWGRIYVPESGPLWIVLLAAPPIGVAVFQGLGLYQFVTRFLGRRGAIRIVAAIILSVLIWALFALLVVGTGDPRHIFPRSMVFIYALLAGLLVWASRELAALGLVGSVGVVQAIVDRRPVIIYGAGTAGVQLLEALRRTGEYHPVGFIDDTPSLIGQKVDGLKVYKEDKLPLLVERNDVKEVLLALPERQRRERQMIIRRLAAHRVRVKTMPTMEDIASGRVSVTDLRAIAIDDLLGRDPVPADHDLLSRAIRGKSIMVTGAGGSIGAELTRQILRLAPTCLVLLDISEVALYEVTIACSDELEKAVKVSTEQPRLVSVLGSVLNAGMLQQTIEKYRVTSVRNP